MNRGLVVYTVCLGQCYVKYHFNVDSHTFSHEGVIIPLTRTKKYGTGYRVGWS